MSPKLYTVGAIANTHGLRGELKIIPHTDFAEERFAPGSKLVAVDLKGKETPVEIASARLHKNAFIVKFKQFHHINEVEPLKGGLLKVEEKYLQKLEEGEYYFHQILGCTVFTMDGEELGVIKDILTPGANHVWVVSGPKYKQILLPYIEDVVKEVDVDNKIVRVELLEGLLDL